MNQRIIFSIQAALLFFIIASPQVYRFVGSLLKTSGTVNLAVTSLLYGILVYVVMMINNR
jgi:hypothetical protein